MPIWLLRKRLGRTLKAEQFDTIARTVDLPHLPDGLCGLKITHLSDLHVGKLLTPEHLPNVVEATNALAGDIIAITGDFIDFSNDYLDPVIDAVRQLDAPAGVYCVLGNHDHLDDVKALTRAFDKAGIELLVNRAVTVDCEGHRVAVGGIDWTARQRSLDRWVRGVADGMGGAELRLLLSHHPHAFDASCRNGVDLTLSGHTHGGQMVFNRKDGGDRLSLSSLSCRYTRGLYQRGRHRLFVSPGVGSWFPWRFRCPAEISLLELQTTY